MMTEFYENTDKIHGAEPIPDKPGLVKGWLKQAPQLLTLENGKQVFRIDYHYASRLWGRFLYHWYTNGSLRTSHFREFSKFRRVFRRVCFLHRLPLSGVQEGFSHNPQFLSALLRKQREQKPDAQLLSRSAIKWSGRQRSEMVYCGLDVILRRLPYLFRLGAHAWLLRFHMEE